jgi:hypothetical protein
VTHRGQSLLASGAAARLILPHLARPYNSRLLAQRDAASLGIDIAIVAYVEHSHCHPPQANCPYEGRDRAQIGYEECDPAAVGVQGSMKLAEDEARYRPSEIAARHGPVESSQCCGTT